MSLANATIATRLPAQDLGRARRWYHDKLGLDPVEERSGGLRYELAGSEFCLFESTGRPSADAPFTQMAWTVPDLDRTLADLRAKGVVFERYDGAEVATIEGNYPSKGSGERAAWFRDSEGNLMGVAETIP